MESKEKVLPSYKISEVAPELLKSNPNLKRELNIGPHE